MTSEIRVRFAPSPTGFLHIGGARTALFNYLFARANHGKFLLRIEDTDRERSEDRFTDDILASLQWLGLNWDEEPVYQSDRFGRYAELAADLVQKGLAYKCECTPAELDAVRAQCEKEKRPFRYPGTCRNKKDIKGAHVLRVKVTTEGETSFTDLIRGEITVQNKDIDDWVIARADGSPTYNFSVVVDDHDLGISHVLRGDDHINNTPKQIQLYKTLGFEVPNFAHLPMIMGADRAKLSKRHGAASTLEYRKMGYLPEAMVNFLVRLGWAYGDQEIFTHAELCKLFSLDRIGKASAIFNVDKLNWYNGHFLKEKPTKNLREYVQKYFSDLFHFAQPVSDELLEKGIGIVQAKVKNIPELIDQLNCLFGEDPAYDVGAMKPEDKTRIAGILKSVAPLLESSEFSHKALEEKVRQEAEKTGQKLGPFAQALRFAVTGGKVSPGLFEMLEVQGKPRVTRRISQALKALA